MKDCWSFCMLTRCWTEEQTCSAASLLSGKVLTRRLWTTTSDNKQNRCDNAENRQWHGHVSILNEKLNRVHVFLTLQICYGIIYGMGAKSLGEQMGVEENDAACYIESFKARYKGKHIIISVEIIQVLGWNILKSYAVIFFWIRD